MKATELNKMTSAELTSKLKELKSELFKLRFQNEINQFVKCVQTGEKLPSNIDIAIKTSKIMEGIYESAKLHREVVY